MKLLSCLGKLEAHFHEDERKELTDAFAKAVTGGKNPLDASVGVVKDSLASGHSDLNDVMSAIAKAQTERNKETNNASQQSTTEVGAHADGREGPGRGASEDLGHGSEGQEAPRAGNVEGEKPGAGTRVSEDGQGVVHNITDAGTSVRDAVEQHANRLIAKDAAPEDRDLLTGGIRVMAERGDTGRLHDVSRIHIDESGAVKGGQYDPQTREITFGRKFLDSFKTGGPFDHSNMAEILDHETWHSADHASEGKNAGVDMMHSSTSPLFEYGGPESKMGDVMSEALIHHENGGLFAEVLAYPFGNVRYFLQKNLVMLKAELFAQLGRVYNVAPDLMREELPKSYQTFKEIHDLAKRENVSLSDAVGRVLKSVPASRGEVRENGNHLHTAERVPSVREASDSAKAVERPPLKAGAAPKEDARKAAYSFGGAKLDDFKSGAVSGILKKKNWSILTAENPGGKALPEELNAARNARMKKDLDKMGVEYQEVKGRYGEPRDENSFVVTGITSEQARDLGKRYGQDSVLTKQGLEHMDGSITPAKDVSVHEKAPEDYFTTMPDGTKFTVNLDFDKRTEPTVLPADISKLLTPDERKFLGEGNGRVAKLISIFNKLPTLTHFVAAAKSGEAARKWYEKSYRAIKDVYGNDHKTFLQLMAALSPQTTVKLNFYNTARVFEAWEKAGRTTDTDKLRAIFRDNLVTDAGREDGKNAMQAWAINGIRVLTASDPDKVRLSGPKVSSFMRNLLGHYIEVTNDRHMADFAGMDKRLLSGVTTKSTEGFGVPGPGYMALNARVREAANKLGWTPAETQAAIWSWWNSLKRLSVQTGKSAVELLHDGSLTRERIAQEPHLGSYLNESEFRRIDADRGRRAEELARDQGGEVGGAAGQGREEGSGLAPGRADTANAKRIDALLKYSADKEAANRAAAKEEGAPSIRDEEGNNYFIKPDGRRASVRELLEKVTSGKAGQVEAQFSKSGKALAEEHTYDPKDLKAYHNASPEMIETLRKAGALVPRQTLAQRWSDLRNNSVDRFLQKTVDYARPILTLLPTDMPYVLTRMVGAYKGAMEGLLKYGRPFINEAGAVDVDRSHKGYFEAAQDLGINSREMAQFHAWRAGARAERLLAEDREHNFDAADIERLKTLNKNDGPLGEWKGEGTRAGAYAQMGKWMDETNAHFLDMGVRAGTMSKEVADRLRDQIYVPFNRVDDDVANKHMFGGSVDGIVNQYFSKRLKGGKEALGDLQENTLRNWSHILESSLKNNAARAVLEAAEKEGYAHKLNDILRDIKESGFVPKEMLPKNAVSLMVDGKQVHYIVDHPDLLDAMQHMSPSEGLKLPPALKWFKHMLTVGTTFSPAFRVAHTIREQIGSLIFGKGSYNPVSKWLNGVKYTSHNNPEFGKMAVSGAFFRMGYSYEDNRAAFAKKLLDHGIDAKNQLDTPQKVGAFFAGTKEWWVEVGERSDSITRANMYQDTYKRLTSEGMNPDEAHLRAAFAARQVLDYSLHGTWGALKAITQVVPFMNARLQGLYSIQQAAAANPKRFAVVAGTVALGTIGLSLANRDDKEIQGLDEWVKDNNWIIRIPGGKIATIPKPFELGALATLIDRGLQAFLNGFNQTDRELLVSRLMPIVGGQLNLNPIANPLVAAPLQIWGNKDWFKGTAIETMRDQKLMPTDRVGPNTSAIAQGASKAINQLHPFQSTLSPEQIDFAINQFFGWVGTHTVSLADLAVRPMAGLPGKPALRVDDVPVFGNFIKTMPSNSSRDVQAFYEHMQQIQDAFGSYRTLLKEGQTEAALKVMEENRISIGLEKAYLTTQRNMGQMNQRERYVNMRQVTDRYSADDKRADLDSIAQQKNAMAANAERMRAMMVNGAAAGR